jgi:hypothetical protein
MLRSTITTCLVLMALDCVAQDPIEDELRLAFERDQSSRSQNGLADPCGDETRRIRVLELLAQGKIESPESRYHAAMILQHTPQGLVGSTITSKSNENYILAHFLARSAAEQGYEDAKWLAAATYDRYLIIQGRPQKYGTQFNLNIETGFLEFNTVDPATTDAERAEWNVPPIEETLRNFEESGMGKRQRPVLTLEELSCSDPASSIP